RPLRPIKRKCSAGGGAGCGAARKVIAPGRPARANKEKSIVRGAAGRGNSRRPAAKTGRGNSRKKSPAPALLFQNTRPCPKVQGSAAIYRNFTNTLRLAGVGRRGVSGIIKVANCAESGAAAVQQRERRTTMIYIVE